MNNTVNVSVFPNSLTVSHVILLVSTSTLLNRLTSSRRKWIVFSQDSYLGPTDFAKGVWVGLELDGPEGKNNSSVSEKKVGLCGVCVFVLVTIYNHSWNLATIYTLLFVYGFKNNCISLVALANYNLFTLPDSCKEFDSKHCTTSHASPKHASQLQCKIMILRVH